MGANHSAEKERTTTKEHLSKHDREIAEVRETNRQTSALIRATTELLNRTARQQRQNTEDIAKLSREVRELTSSLRRGGSNGHAKRKIDLS